MREPVALIACVSLHERRIVKSMLRGFPALVVEDAQAAATQLAADGEGVLVIDAGLLEGHDSQWRQLRAQHPELSAVVRCLTPRSSEGRREDPLTLRVHPADDGGLREAIRALAKGLRPPRFPGASRPVVAQR
jgi:hypothetical protein